MSYNMLKIKFFMSKMFVKIASQYGNTMFWPEIFAISELFKDKSEKWEEEIVKQW